MCERCCCDPTSSAPEEDAFWERVERLIEGGEMVVWVNLYAADGRLIDGGYVAVPMPPRVTKDGRYYAWQAAPPPGRYVQIGTNIAAPADAAEVTALPAHVRPPE